VLSQKKRTVVEEDPDTAADFQRILVKGMPKDHRAIDGVELSFDKVYRWHPVANEEMVIGRWMGKPRDGKPFYEIAVFKVCGHKAWPTARMRGPVARVGKPKVGINARKLSFDVETRDKRDAVKLSFWHGTVKVTQPNWIKKGNTLELGAASHPRLRRRRLQRKLLKGR